jgi:ligand-binding sensor domain-containing protein
MKEDREGQIWILGNGTGVFVINTQNETIKQFGTKEGLLHTFLVGILQDRQGLIWITTGLGVHIIDLKTGTDKRLQRGNGLSRQGCNQFIAG